MNTQNNPAGWAVLAGAALIALGVWLLLGGPFSPIAWLISAMWHIGWPLALVALGILLIIRARGGGFNVNGKKLYRSRTNRMVGGVMGGLADYLGVDATVLRIIYAVLTIFTGFFWGVVLYVLAMIIVPDEFQPQSWTPGSYSGYSPPAPPAPPVPQSPGAATPPPAPSSYASPSTPPSAPPVPQAPAPAPATPPASEPPAAPPVPEAPSADSTPPDAPSNPSEPTIL